MDPSKTKTIYTITYGECGENHAGMQLIGKTADVGFSIDDLNLAMERLKSDNVTCQWVDFISPCGSEKAAVLVVRGGVEYFSNAHEDEVLAEQESIKYDTRYYDTRRKKVLNKQARHNVCFDNISQEPDLANKKGTIIVFEDVPLLDAIRKKLPIYLGEKADNMIAEGNKYYDSDKCGIGWHGDAERKRVVAIRLGGTMDLWYSWFNNCKPVGDPTRIVLEHGDMYIMSEKAVGSDWKKRSHMTLRHSAGCEKYTSLKKHYTS